jgi:hypothetical protein
MMNKKIVLYSIICILLFSCKKSNFEDDELSISKTPFLGNQLRIDGYYYNRYSVSGGHNYNIYFFYENGIVLYGGGFSEDKIAEIENKYRTGELPIYAQERKYYWGLFIVEGDKIMFETWNPGPRPYKAYIKAGGIINDTSFVINERYRLVDGVKTDHTDQNDLYIFKYFSPKPSNVNPYL